MIIYKLCNKINSKIYIGQTSRTLNIRLVEHKNRLKYYKEKGKTNSKLYNALSKYGFENFEVEIIDKASTIDLLNEREKFWISFYNSELQGYNSTDGGLNGTISIETRKKISETLKGHGCSEETRKKIGLKSLGRKIPRSKEWVEKRTKPRIKKNCKHCLSNFFVREKELLKLKREFCSGKCRQTFFEIKNNKKWNVLQ
ncbi:MAG: GIY-YIG nuclease family protein [Bacteroidia bacterium]